jgi:hypothetical protein
MTETLSILEFLESDLGESRGLVARNLTDVYSSPSGEDYSFLEAVIFPGPKTAKVINTNEELNQLIFDYIKKNKLKLMSSYGNQNRGTKAAILAIFKSPKGKKVAWLRYFTTIGRAEGRGKWTDAMFFRDTGLMRKYNTSTSGEIMPVKPSMLVETDKLYTPSELFDAVSSSVEKHASEGKIPRDFAAAIIKIVQAAAFNQENPALEGQISNTNIFNKYIGEILAPLSVVNGWNFKGARERSQEKLLVGELFSECLIAFPSSANESLYDSYLMSKDGKKVKISSKGHVSGKAGAASSLSSVHAILEMVLHTNPEAYAELQKKYGRIFAILVILEKESAVSGVLTAAILAGLIKDSDRDFILGLIAKNTSLVTFKRHYRTPGSLEKLANSQGDITPTKISKLADVNPGYKPGFHLLAIVAKALGNLMNSNDMFHMAIMELLSFESFIQVISSVRVEGDNLFFEPFNIIYPPEHEGRIVASPGKYFYSTGMPKGKFPFRIT